MKPLLDSTKKLVLLLMISGYRTHSIARKLNKHPSNINAIKAAMRDYLGAKTDAEIVAKSIEYGELRFDSILGDWR